MAKDLRNRVVVITGASSGIGAATALRCGEAGMRVVLAARREDVLRDIAARVEAAGGEALVCPTDVRDRAQIERMAHAAEARFGRVDVLLANAGIGYAQALALVPHETIDATVEVNLLGVIRSAKAVLPGMIERGSGHVITVSSVAAGLAVSRASVYAATKAGVHRFCESLRREVGRHGIYVTDVLPGVIDTPMTERLSGWPKAPVAGVADVIVGVMRRPRRWVVTPWWYHAALAANRLAPWALDAVLGHFEAKERRAEAERAARSD